MFCHNCGLELKGHEKFCARCGAPVEHPGAAPQSRSDTSNEGNPENAADSANQAPDIPTQSPAAGPANQAPDIPTQSPAAGPAPDSGEDTPQAFGHKRRNLKIALGVLLALLVCTAGGTGIHWSKLKAREASQAAQLAAQLQVEGKPDFGAWLSDYQARFGQYQMSDTQRQELLSLVGQAQALDGKDFQSAIDLAPRLQALERQVKEENEAALGREVERLSAIPTPYATQEELTALASFPGQIRELAGQGQYLQAMDLTGAWASLTEQTSERKTGYTLNIKQMDLTRFPTVRLYLDIRDGGDNPVMGLSPNMFFISEKDAQDGQLQRRLIIHAAQLNENEPLSINLVADISSSMSDYNKIGSAKDIILNFLETVQFHVGDTVKLTPFNSFIDKSGYFTSDVNALSSSVNAFQADGQTKLYDTLIYAVQDSFASEGAKCVIAFTDGMDVGSYSSAQDVVRLVSQYDIPVFIVRIGSDLSYEEEQALRSIAEASHGSFKSLQDFGSDMTSFYDQIYREMKQYYMVEYDSSPDWDITRPLILEAYASDGTQGGTSQTTITPGEDIFNELLGSYLRSYIRAMNARDYSLMESYVDSDVASDNKRSIQWQMKKQVSGGFENVTEESLLDYAITGIEKQSDTSYILRAAEKYDTIYSVTYGELKADPQKMAKDALGRIASTYGEADLIPDGTVFHLWAVVDQKPAYLVTKTADGAWRFTQYMGDLGISQTKDLYYMEMQ